MEKYHKTQEPAEKAKIELNPIKVFLTALENCKPILTINKLTRGGITYQVPVPLTEKDREFKAANNIITSCQINYLSARDKKLPLSFSDRLAHELLDASNFQVRIKPTQNIYY